VSLVRNVLRLIIALALLCALAIARGNVRAQPASQRASVVRLLESYDVPAAQLPAGLTLVDHYEVPNYLLAANDQDPSLVQQRILDAGRVDELERVFHGSAGGTGTLYSYLVLFRDAASAQSDVNAVPSHVPPGALTQEAAPALGDTSFAFLTSGTGASGTAFDEVEVGFAAGRLAVFVLETGPTGSVQESDILPLATLYAQQAAVPPPPPTDAEVALLQTQASPESVLYDAYSLLLTRHGTQLSPAALLSAAFKGAETTVGSSANLPAAPVISSSDPD
jgi:hypothetical protein